MDEMPDGGACFVARRRFDDKPTGAARRMASPVRYDEPNFKRRFLFSRGELDPAAMARRHWRARPLKLSSWLRAGTAVTFLVFVSGIVLNERRGQEAALLHAEDQSSTLAHALAQNVSDTFQIADLGLVSLSRLLGAEPPTRSKLQAVNLDMNELLGRVPRIQSLSYFEESGWRLASSPQLTIASSNQSRSQFFSNHRGDPNAGLVVGSPFRADASSPFLIPLSRRIAADDGRFAGVLLATIPTTYFSDFYASFDSGTGVRVVLLGTDGAILTRYPRDDAVLGMNLSSMGIFKDVQSGVASGTKRMKSPIDGVDRITAFHTVDGMGLTVIASFSREAALAPWRQGIYVRVPIFVLLAGLVLLGGLRLATHVDRRQMSENRLRKLSRTDALTGLLNRRAFDEALAIAWLESATTGRPMSLLMIDVDCFKAFNDSYGHPAGDTCLQIVALSICEVVGLPEERVTRYGGEEIAVILPDTGEAEAMAVARRIRSAIAALRVSHAQSTVSDYVTVSIGCATDRRDGEGRATPGDLLADADRALYSAKLAGRDRVTLYDDCNSPVRDDVCPNPMRTGQPYLRLVATAD